MFSFSIEKTKIILEMLFNSFVKIVREYDQEIPQSKNCRQTHGTARKSHTTIAEHLEDKLSKKKNSSLFPIKMIAKLECI